MPGPSFLTVFRRVLAAFFTQGRHSLDRRPGATYQVAAMPVKVTATGKLKVLLISARGSGKLIIPRGWPMSGKADFQAAQIEAHEEAGVQGPISLFPIGSYEYRSNRKAGGAPIRVDVYRLDVVRSAPRFKEKGQRRLLWLDPDEAAERVGEPGLVPILREVGRHGVVDGATSAGRQPPSPGT